MTSQSTALQPGSHIGDLQINAILGVGAFGITYLVTDPAIGTRFALKEYLPAEYVTRQEDGSVIPNDDDSAPSFRNGPKTIPERSAYRRFSRSPEYRQGFTLL